jgi:hypothetical protein
MVVSTRKANAMPFGINGYGNIVIAYFVFGIVMCWKIPMACWGLFRLLSWRRPLTPIAKMRPLPARGER